MFAALERADSGLASLEARIFKAITNGDIGQLDDYLIFLVLPRDDYLISGTEVLRRMSEFAVSRERALRALRRMVKRGWVFCSKRKLGKRKIYVYRCSSCRIFSIYQGDQL